MRMTDSHGYTWIRERSGTWRMALPDEEDPGLRDDPEGYMHGWYHGLMCGLTIGLIAIVLIAWVQSYAGAAG